MFGIILTNIKNSIYGYRKMYILLIVSQILTTILLFFVYGIFGSYNAQKQELDIDSYSFDASFNGDVTIKQIKECLPDILDKNQANLDFFVVLAFDDVNNIQVGIRSEYFNGTYSLSNTVYGDRELRAGRWLNSIELTDGDKVVMGINAGNVGDMVIIGDEEYEIIGIDANSATEDMAQATGWPYIEMSLNACPDNIRPYSVSMDFNKLPTYSEYKVFRDGLKSAFGNNVEVSEFNVKDEEELIAINSIIIISVIIGINAALDTALIYGYIMKKRKKQMAVFGITGANKMQRIMINELEIIFISIVTTVMGFVIFKFGIENKMMSIYGSSVPIYNMTVYGIMMGVFVLTIIVFTLVITLYNTKKKLIDVRREQ